MLYFLLVVRFGWSEERIRKYCEPAFHAVPNLLGWGFGIAGIPLGLYKPVAWTCFIQDVPYACKKAVKQASVHPSQCQGHDVNVTAYRWAFFFAWIWATFILMFVSMTLIYLGLRKTELNSERYTFSAKANISAVTNNLNSNAAEVPSDADHGSSKALHSHDTDFDTVKPKSATITEESKDEISTHPSRLSSSRQDSWESMLSSSRESARRKASSTGPGKKNSRKFAAQAALYVTFFMVTWIFATVQGSIYAIFGTGYSYLLVMITILSPLQGFFNMLIYVRPRLIKRKVGPRLTTWFCGLFCQRGHEPGEVEVSSDRRLSKWGLVG